MINIKPPQEQEYHPYYGNFIDRVKNESILLFLEKQGNAFEHFIKKLTKDELRFRYEEGKWSRAELIGHLMDVERIFSYRALAISRKERTNLPGYDPDTYVSQSNYGERSAESMAEEYSHQRKSNISFFKSINEEMSKQTGQVNGVKLSVRALIYLIGGHQNHHEMVLKEKYPINT